MKKNLLFIALALLTLMSSCVKDHEEFIPNEGINYTSNIMGIVTDESNQPVEGATVIYDGVTKTTDKNGIYTFKNVSVGSVHSFIKIRKAGYFEASRAFNTQKPANIQLKNILVTKDFNKNFQAASGGTVAANGYEIKFPADAIVIESSGAAYTGKVSVATKYLDPNLDATSYKMPGNLTGLTASNSIEKLNTFGMLAVELQSASGEKLQIKSGQQVEIAVDAIPNAPVTVPLWYFDETLGYWKEEGTAELVNGKYIGKVSHFSWWNYDASRPSINVSGKVVDQNGNPVVCEIWFTVPGEYGGHGQTNSDGTYSGPIGKDIVLDLSIKSPLTGCSNGPIFTSQVGPFSSDVVLPDITVTITGPQTFSCTATVNDCNGNPVQDGYLKVTEGFNNHFFPVINGQVTATYFTCANPITTTITGVNYAELKESDPIVLTGPGPHILTQPISACAKVLDYFKIKCGALGVDDTFTEFFLLDSFSVKSIYAYGVSSGGKIEYVNISYEDGGTNYNEFKAGLNFPITSAGLYLLQGSAKYALVSGTVSISQGGAAFGDTVIGEYQMIMENTQTQAQETFTGSFQRKI